MAAKQAAKPQAKTIQTELPASVKAMLDNKRKMIGLRRTDWPLGEYVVHVVAVEVVPSKPKVVNGKLQEPTRPNWLAVSYTVDGEETGEVYKGAVPQSADADFRTAAAGDSYYIRNEGKAVLDGENMARYVFTAVKLEGESGA